MPEKITATVQLLGVELGPADREKIETAAGSGFRVRWSVPSDVALFVDEDQRPHTAFIVRLRDLDILSVVSPRGEETAGSAVWRGVEQLVSGIWRGQTASDDRVVCDAYAVFGVVDDLVAIKLVPPDPSRVDEALNAQLESLSGQWDSILGEFHEQTRGPTTRVYVLSGQDGVWTLRSPEESERFLRVMEAESS